MRERFIFSTFVSLAVMAAPVLSATASGEAIYQRRCASCHDHPAESIPPRAALQQLSAARILRVLNFGVMMNIGYSLDPPERSAVAKYLGVDRPDNPVPAQAYCSNRTVQIGASPSPAWNGWGPDASNARYTASGGVSLDQVGKLKLKWAYGFDGDVSAIGAPTVLGNTLFVGSANGAVQALSTESGCVRWVYQATGPVRSAVVAVPNGNKHILVFTDLTGWAYGVDAATGRQIWRKKPDQHETARLTGSVAVHNGVVFIPVSSSEEPRANDPKYACCTFRGSVVALRASDGAQIWKTYTIREAPKQTDKGGVGTWGPSGGGVWSSPTVDTKRGLLYVTTGDNYSSPATDMSDSVLALDLKTGRIVWAKQLTSGDIFSGACQPASGKCPGPDYDFGSSAILEKLPNGRDILLAGQKSGIVYGLDPDRKGEILWKTRVGKGGTNGGIQWGMASDGQKVYAAVSDLVRKGGLGSAADPTRGGGLTALRIANGAKVWYAAPQPCGPRKGCSPAQPAAVTAIPGAVFSGSDDGHVRAFSTEDGHILWDFDTVRDYKTVNGVQGKGGSLDGAGPIIAGGMLFVNSGYARNGGIAGNVLLAFAPSE